MAPNCERKTRILVALSPIEDSTLAENFCGSVVSVDDLASLPTVAGKQIYPYGSVTLYPGSVLLIPLSTNRLYTHTVRPPKLDAERLTGAVAA